MSNMEHKNDLSIANFMAGWKRHHENALMPEAFALIGLTNYGERPVPSARLAEVLGRSVSEAETLARQFAWPGTRVENRLITVNPERVPFAPRRQLARCLPLCAPRPPIP